MTFDAGTWWLAVLLLGAFGYALLTAALLVWPIAALLSVLLERGYTRSMRQEKRFRTGWAFLFILACYVPMFGVAFPCLLYTSDAADE